MNNNVISGSLVYKGEPGLSAYELAVQNGYEGTLDEWLRSLGTSSMFNQYSASYTTTESTTDFELPEEYIEGGFVDVYVDGLHIKSSEYSVANENNSYLVRFNTAVSSGKSVELLTTMISTQNLPISDTTASTSTNDTASGSKAVYDYVGDYIESKKSSTINEGSTNDTISTSKAVYDYVQVMLDTIYPVGSIYMSVNSANPSIWFGGTWEAWGSGRVPVGVNVTDTSFNEVEKTGGEKTHALSINEMPSHTHAQNSHRHKALRYTINHSQSGNNIMAVYTAESPNGESQGYTDYVTATNKNTGGSQSHNNLQPYITCYMWKRTA